MVSVSVALSLSSIRWRRGSGRGGAARKPPSPTLPPLVPRGERESSTGLNRYAAWEAQWGAGSLISLTKPPIKCLTLDPPLPTVPTLDERGSPLLSRAPARSSVEPFRRRRALCCEGILRPGRSPFLMTNRTVLITCLLVATAATACRKSQPGAGAPGAAAGGFAVQAIVVDAKVQPVSESLSLVGTTAANEIVEIKSETDGTVEEIPFTEGQKVKAGDLLLRLDEVKFAAAVAECGPRAGRGIRSCRRPSLSSPVSVVAYVPTLGVCAHLQMSAGFATACRTMPYGRQRVVEPRHSPSGCPIGDGRDGEQNEGCFLHTGARR